MSRFTEDHDEDLRREAIDERRRRARATHCACNPRGDWPGHCPGPLSCPYSGLDDDDGEGAL